MINHKRQDMCGEIIAQAKLVVILELILNSSYHDVVFYSKVPIESMIQYQSLIIQSDSTVEGQRKFAFTKIIMLIIS